MRLSVEDIWDEDGLHVRSTNPTPYWAGPIQSRLLKRYPVFGTEIRLPKIEAGKCWKLQFETGQQGAAGDCAFYGKETECRFRAHTRAGLCQFNIVSLLPSDYDTADNVYRLAISKGQCHLFINQRLRAVILYGLPQGIPVWENNPPYGLGSVTGEMGTEFNFKLAAWSPDESTEFTFPLRTDEPCFGMYQGQAHPPRQIPLYTENTDTIWRGLDTGGSQMTSHPVPIWGYPNKTLYFKSDAAGTLDIEIYVGGGWQVYDTVSLSANELESYPFPKGMQAPIMRCVYTPTDADTISLAEVNLA